jgi:hypothetical protein
MAGARVGQVSRVSRQLLLSFGFENNMKRQDGSEFWKTGLRRKMSIGEEAEWQIHLADQPEARAQFQEELSLNRALQRLPDIPVSSNFTALVMQAVEREYQHRSRPMLWRLWADYVAFNWGRKLAFGSALLLLGVLSYQQYQLSARRALAMSLSSIESVLPVEGAVEDFRAAYGLRRVPTPSPSEEMDLFAALQP